MGREEATPTEIQPIDREWFLAAARCDYHEIDRLLHINSALASRKVTIFLFYMAKSYYKYLKFPFYRTLSW